MMTEPRWLGIARKYIGVREVPGPQHNQTIMGWLRKLGSWIKDDETPWCGSFCAAVMQEAGLPYPNVYPRAKAWAEYGSRLQPHLIAPGAILVFAREGGGHVGFYVAEDATHYHVLGGNQGNSVSVTRIAKARMIASRWPKGEPVRDKPVWVKANGLPVSENEA
jgi:uncharacterized protein (TIGR02594 family)